MMNKKQKEKFIVFKAIIILIFCLFILILGNYVTEGIYGGLLLCTQILIPSLFPFMILSNLTVKTSVADYMGRYFHKITHALFGVSGNCGAVILLGLIGGYPVGAKGISNLYKENKISEKEAIRLSYSLVCAGPGFLITYIGISTLDCKEIGFCLLASQMLSVVILSFINKFIFKSKNDIPTNTNSSFYNNTSFSEALVESVKDSTYCILEMCGTVTLFSALLSVLEMLLSDNLIIVKYISIILEVTTASNYLCSDYNILLLAFAVGFGGLSIHFQIFQSLKNISINRWIFILYRITQGIITSVFTYIFTSLFNISAPTYSSIISADFTLSTTIVGSILLIITGICFLNTASKEISK